VGICVAAFSVLLLKEHAATTTRDNAIVTEG
jgi:hypothetical protein